jgi:hypothetical protein
LSHAGQSPRMRELASKITVCFDQHRELYSRGVCLRADTRGRRRNRFIHSPLFQRQHKI